MQLSAAKGQETRAVPAEITETPGLRFMPVIVITSSQSEEDIPATCRLYADNCHVAKPMSLDGFFEF